MAGGYTVLPEFYDFLGKHPDYKSYGKTILDLYQKIGAKESGLILDLACGTGKLTMALSAEGADVIGVDNSPEMLSVARENCRKKGFSPLFLMQDMRELDLYGTVDVVVCATNSLNYLESEEDLQKVFSLVHNFLTPGGLFFFDINSRYKFEKMYGDNVYVFEAKNAYLIWQNQYKKRKKECIHDLTIFKKETDGRYSRREESQKQVYFPAKKLKKQLAAAGFELLSEGRDYQGRSVKTDSPDIFYLARCIKQGQAYKV